MKRLLAADLETTGKDTATARIWQVATNEREWLVNPGVPIPDEIRELCHINDALLARIQSAPIWADVQAEVLEHLCSADALVTMNGIRYDEPVLRAHIGDSIALPPVIDVRVLAFEAYPNIQDHKVGEVVYSGHKLANVALHLGLVTGEDLAAGAHDARFDCGLTLNVYHRLPPKWTADLERLLAFQQRAYQIQLTEWEDFGVVPEDGPRYLCFRFCRKCRQGFTGQKMGQCADCYGWGILHQTKKRQDQPVDAGYLAWLRKRDNCPPALRGENNMNVKGTK